MQHNVKFLEAVHIFISGGKAADLMQAIHQLTPSAADMSWVLNMYRAANGKADIHNFNGDFIAALSKELEDYSLKSDENFSVMPTFDDERRSDMGMYKRMPSELGMSTGESHLEPSIFEQRHGRSKELQLYYALKLQGWMSLSHLLHTAHGNSGSKTPRLHDAQELARQHKLENTTCSFRRGSMEYMMISPQLCALYLKHRTTEKLLPRQPGERVKSMFPANLRPLLAIIPDQLAVQHIPVELAIVRRDGHSSKPTCLTPIFQEVLSDAGLIKIRSENINLAVFKGDAPVPTQERALQKLAKSLCKELKIRADAAKKQTPLEASDPERFIARHKDSGRGGSR